MSGLPVFDRERTFRGYRGFGVCRDIGRINELIRARRERPIGFMSPPEAPEPPASAAAPAVQAEAVPVPPQPPPTAETKVVAVAAPAPMEAAAEVAPRVERTPPSIVPAAANVVPFRSGTTPEPKAPSLSPGERKAFRELAQELSARLRGEREDAVAEQGAEEPATAEQTADARAAAAASARAAPEVSEAAAQIKEAEPAAPQPAPEAAQRQTPLGHEHALLDRIPVGVLVYRNDALLYANRYFLEFSGYASLEALAAAGGLDALFGSPDAGVDAAGGAARSVQVVTRSGERRPGRGAAVDRTMGRGVCACAHGHQRRSRGAAAGRRAHARRRPERNPRAHGEARILSSKSEDELRAATREAQKAAAAKADFLAQDQP